MKYAHIYICLIIFFSGSSCFGRGVEDNRVGSNAIQLANVFENDTAYLNHLINEARKYNTNKTTIEEARTIINEAEKLIESKKLETPPLLYITRAEFFLTLRDFVSSSKELESFKEKVGKKADLLTSCEYNNVAGNYASEAGLFDISIRTFQNNVELAKKNHLKGILPKSYGGLVNVYSAIDMQPEVKNNLELMLESSLAENDVLSVYKAYLRKGQFLRSKEQAYPEAHSSYQEALKYARILNDTLKIIVATNAIAWNYYSQNKLDSSIVWFTSMLNYATLINNFTHISNANGNLGTIYRDQKAFPKAIEYYQKGIDFALKDRSWFNLSWIYDEISKLYEINRDFEKAYHYQILFKLYSDSLNKNSLNQGLADARVRYEVQAKESELQVLSLRFKNQKLFFYGFAGVLLLTVVIGVLLIRQWRLNSKRRISEMNQKISEITQANLRQQMNPHFIFNTLNSIQYYMYQNDKLSTNNYLTKFSSLMRKILENSQHTAVPLIDELNAVELYLELESIRFKNKFDYSIELDEEIDTLMYKVPTMLIQPYVENAICHGLMHREDKGFLSIDIRLKPDHLSCIIIDNGIGREAAMEISKMKENNHSPLGTKITESRIDLINILYGSSLKTIYSDLKDEAGIAIGTKVEIQIPILT
ncbi:MAG: hypothetical protein CVU00_14405 [Bacteroidetes bacterium HGW-Bacteroidetes-17]|nr:MAG: hypothetical protein CVU00_14405 [Bacteroidetes bacterium HGW-Bacteroidetes-17]